MGEKWRICGGEMVAKWWKSGGFMVEKTAKTLPKQM